MYPFYEDISYLSVTAWFKETYFALNVYFWLIMMHLKKEMNTKMKYMKNHFGHTKL